MPGSKNAGSGISLDSGPGESKQAAGTRESASGRTSQLGPLAPAPPPPRLFARPRIGLALGGGGALGLSEIGALQWLDEHHIPVDVIAGTSIGCLVSSLYSTGRTPSELENIVNDKVFTSVFSFHNAYTSRSFRRRADARNLPNALTIGLRHGISLRNSVLTDQGLNAFLDREFLRYDDQTEFNALPIPLRCVATDLTDATVVTFARGSIQDAVRASVSLPAVYQPFSMNGHEFVDGGVLENLPTAAVKAMGADVVLAISIPLAPIGPGELNSLLGILQRSFSVAIEGAEREQRKLADVVIVPDLKTFNSTDYLKSVDLARRGYAAAEAHKAELLRYALPADEWANYEAHLASLRRGPPGPILRVRVRAPAASTERAVQQMFRPLVNEPVNTDRIEALLDQVRSDGRYDADYTVGYETTGQLAQQRAGVRPVGRGVVDVPIALSPSQVGMEGSKESTSPIESKGTGTPNGNVNVASDENGKHEDLEHGGAAADRPGAKGEARTRGVSPESLKDIGERPVVLVTVDNKKTGPPFLLLGGEIKAQTGGVGRASIEGILLYQDLGGYGAELRSHIRLGYVTELSAEYYRPLPFSTPEKTFFLEPHGGIVRHPYPIFVGDRDVDHREYQTLYAGGDAGLSNQRNSELRVGYDYSKIRWYTVIGNDGKPDYDGTTQRVHLGYNFDNQDRALVPQFGVSLSGDAGYLYSAVGSENAPQLKVRSTYAHLFRFTRHPLSSRSESSPEGKQVLLAAIEAGTMFGRRVAAPYQYTLGGPLRLTASAIDQYRGTDYFLLEPALLRRIAQLPQPLGQSIYLGGGYEIGRIGSPGLATLTRQDFFFGLFAETPVGVITLTQSFGDHGEHKFTFTLGKLF
jgi:NTE family protein